MPLSDGYTDVPPGRLAAVVTYLEMRSSPQPPGAPPPPGFEVRLVSHPSLDWYRDLFRRVGQDWLWFSRLRMPDAELAAILHDERVDLLVLSVAGEEAGYIELDRRSPPDIEIAFFGVVPGFIGKGAGCTLLEAGLDLAWSHEPARVWLHTCTLDHPRALDFYRRAGFVPYKRAIEISADPRLTGEVPLTSAPQIPML